MVRLVEFLLIFLCRRCFISCNYLPFVKMGGILRFFYSSGIIDPSGLEYTSAALMAIQEINKNPYILPHTKLLFSIEVPRPLYLYAVQSAERLAQSHFNNTGVNVVIGPTFTATTKASAQIFAQFDIAQVGWNSDSELSYKENYPYYLRTVPADSFQASVLADVIYHKFDWKTVAVFFSDDYFGSSSYLEFSSECDELGITILNSYIFIKGVKNIRPVTTKAASSLASIFVILADAYDTATLLVDGNEMGIFNADSQILGTSFAATKYLIDALPSTVNKVSILKGFIALIPAVDVTTSKISEFMTRWKAQNNTVINHSDGTQTCNNQKDDDQSTYLYKGKPNGEGANYPYICTGIDYSKYSSNATSMNNLTFYVYDTVYAIANALHILIYEKKVSKITANGLIDVMLNNGTLDGLTGNITFAKGKEGYEHYGFGDRRSGAYHRLVNFQECVDVSGGVSYPCLKTIGSWHSENGFRSCLKGKYSDCAEIVYNTVDNSKPIDWPDPILVHIATSSVVVLWIMAVICLLVILFFLAMVVIYRKTTTIKSSQPSMLYFILYGGLFGVGYIIVNSMEVNVSSCIVGQWLAHLSYCMVFGSFVVKTWRVHKLFNSGLKRVVISTGYINSVVCSIIALTCLYLLLMSALSTTRITYSTTTHGRYTYQESQCTSTLPVMSTVLFAIEAASLLFGARLCWLTKGLPDDINESAHIASAIYSILFVCIVVFPAKYLLNLSPNISHVIVSIGFFITLLSSMLALFLPKAIKIAQKGEINVSSIVANRSSDMLSKLVERAPSAARIFSSTAEYNDSASKNPPNPYLSAIGKKYSSALSINQQQQADDNNRKTSTTPASSKKFFMARARSSKLSVGILVSGCAYDEQQQEELDEKAPNIDENDSSLRSI